MNVVRAELQDRPVRVAVPVRVTFSGSTFLIKEFTANLSVGGIFLQTENMVEPGVEGHLTFRGSQWERPFTIRAVVVRAVPPNPESRQTPGLGLQFLEIDDASRKSLQRLVDGIQDGSVVEAIRRSIREGASRDLLEEIRKRPIDQRLMLALQAAGEEIDALIRDGNAVVIERMMENPRLSVRHVRTISRDPRLPTQTLMALRRQGRWINDEEVRFNFCSHRSAPMPDVLNMLAQLSVGRLKQMTKNANLRPQVQTRARELLRRQLRSGGA
jgi:uncharacterized protein (TIGR02266 family)